MDDLTSTQRKGHGGTPGESEFCWGAGNAPKAVADLPPSQGGPYRGTTPRDNDAPKRRS
ncbi:hypothetical protein O4220_19590 [Rhodococcus ruber]|uniref:Uncharacterized protein n=1 Tax=Rhodococcus ruber TaxID=1830 RepID=A0ABT4MIA1_9NOCA|nr:hypothetical protein [Rhodococcus ruber]MCZ4520718.1 hypothetical protein [Rhodococcus ruber]